MQTDQEARKQKRLEALGSNNPVCVTCGESDWRCLEQHHIAGKDYDESLATTCRNCHRKLSDTQKDHPPKLAQAPSTLESIGHLLLGLADLFAMLVEKLREYGQFLLASAKQLATA